MVRIELFGVPQLKASQKEVLVDAATLGGAMRALAVACPALAGSVVDGDRLTNGYVVALNGQHVTVDPGTVLTTGDVLVLMSAQAGG